MTVEPASLAGAGPHWYQRGDGRILEEAHPPLVVAAPTGCTVTSMPRSGISTRFGGGGATTWLSSSAADLRGTTGAAASGVGLDGSWALRDRRRRGLHRRGPGRSHRHTATASTAEAATSGSHDPGRGHRPDRRGQCRSSAGRRRRRAGERRRGCRGRSPRRSPIQPSVTMPGALVAARPATPAGTPSGPACSPPMVCTARARLSSSRLPHA